VMWMMRRRLRYRIVEPIEATARAAAPTEATQGRAR